MNLVISLRSEALKTKSTAAVYFTLIAAFFGPFMTLLDASHGEGVSPGEAKVIFNKLMTDKFQMASLVMFPMFIVLICTLLPQIEYKNNAWKQVLTSPQKKANIFLAKFLSVNLLMLVFLAVNFFAMLLTATVLHFREPSLNVLSQPLNGYEILMLRVNLYVSLLAMTSIQFWLGLRFKNFIVPIAVGITCWILGSMLVFQFESGIAEFFPYSFQAYSAFTKYKPQLTTVQWTSVVYAITFLIIGFMNFNRKGSKA